MKVLHQAGHNTVWNIDSLKHGVGDGIVFSPVHYTSANVSKVSESIKELSLFDPQYYMPGSQKSKLHTYEFFPDKIMNGFETSDFCNVAHDSARLCLEYQAANNFEAFIIPCRFFPEMVTDFVSQQVAFTVDAFLEELPNFRSDKNVFLSLPLSIAMIQDIKYRTEILNWVTSYPDIDGIYLQTFFEERTKQVHNYTKLDAYLKFVREMTEADLKVICGYSNLEGLLASIYQLWGVTIGAYENTRVFSIDKFIDDDKIQMGPAPRIYLPGLLNWIRYDTAKEIMEDCPDIWEQIYMATPEATSVLGDSKAPHFSQPYLYKHYFRLAYTEYKDLVALNPKERCETLFNRVNSAIEFYKEIRDRDIQFFDVNCSGEHLNAWRRVLKNLRGTL